ncbi:MAG TPA: sodium:solute symporter family protein [Flavobacteriales bacterium]|nr:sodium:solute symporter family protein [Flavobacteriales bacterium]HQW39858.1 sodium:solute symporter family protein [Flavobacteriales bacterium]
MHWIDASIFILYMVVLLAVGFRFMRKNNSAEDYFVGGRTMGPGHIGLSVVATDVGGGFSIGLGGLGFVMGLSGSWMLFTGLVGAWLAAVLLIPRVYAMGRDHSLLTFPQLLGKFFDGRVAFVAGIICVVGYLGFTSSQLLAGAKLASAAVDGLDLGTALLIMGAVTVGYTVLGGMKAVVYTDTIQWVVLLTGLAFIGVPMAWVAVGGWEAIRNTVEPSMLRLDNITAIQLINWGVTIVPIWFVGMTLYQRIYASRSEKEARIAWFIAGLLEWPVMAFLGVLLGMLAKVAADQGLLDAVLTTGEVIDPEMGLPLLLRAILPVGLMGIMLSVYFSAILSTADSCLMAASGNLLTDIVERFRPSRNLRHTLRLSQIFTLVLGAIAIAIAAVMENVLSLMLHSYAFMVSGLLVPLVAAVFFGQRNPYAALAAMIIGGVTTVSLSLFASGLPFGLDPNVFGILAATVAFASVATLLPQPVTRTTL